MKITDYGVCEGGYPCRAMGHKGVPRIVGSLDDKMMENGKLNIVDQIKWLYSHSGMKIPSKDLMKFVYEREIMRLEGLGVFGLYELTSKKDDSEE
jgi:hypothetical protein